MRLGIRLGESPVMYISRSGEVQVTIMRVSNLKRFLSLTLLGSKLVFKSIVKDDIKTKEQQKKKVTDRNAICSKLY